jgi:hypothetical protein
MNKSIITLLLLAGCSSFIEKRAASQTFQILQRGNEAARRLADVDLARAAAPSGIVQAAAFAAAYPDHRGFRELYAESVCQYSIGFVFDDWDAAVLEGRGAEARRIATRLDGLLATCVDLSLGLLPATWREAMTDDARWTALLASLEREQVPFLLHIASAEGVRIALNPLAAGIPRLDRAIATLSRCTELAPGLRDAEGEILLGSLLAGRSRFLGGPDGEAQFQAARRLLGPSAVLVDVTYARAISVARQDRESFLRHLDAALAADLSRWPDRRLANELARAKAERYRAAADTLIPQVATRDR